MKRNSPFGVGRLMRAVICGLLATTVIPAAASADTTVTKESIVPFAVEGCTEAVEGTARFHDTTKFNITNGSTHTTLTLHSVEVTGLVSGARYQASEQTVTTFQMFPPSSVFEQDIITKVTRVGEVTTAGMKVPDDMVMKMHFHSTFNANGVPTATFSHPVVHCN